MAERRPRESSYAAVRNVCCEHHEGVLILRGCVPTYYLKQIAQTLVREVKGVDQIVNRLEVVELASDLGVTNGDQQPPEEEEA